MDYFIDNKIPGHISDFYGPNGDDKWNSNRDQPCVCNKNYDLKCCYCGDSHGTHCMLSYECMSSSCKKWVWFCRQCAKKRLYVFVSELYCEDCGGPQKCEFVSSKKTIADG